MPTYRQTERRNADVTGYIDPNGYYDTQAVMRAIGIGDEKLMELRESGRLPVYRLDGQGRNFYRGSDLVSLLTPYRKDNKRRATA